jgi:glycogen debranching enzyme
MALEIKVGPPQLAIHHGASVLVTDTDGQIDWPSERGLYVRDTRLISSWAIYANGEPWELLNSGTVTYYAARIFLTNKAFLTEDGEIPPRTLGLAIGRTIQGGVHEDLDITNHGDQRVRFNLEIAMRSDFADIFEVKSNRIVRRGRITTEWSAHAQKLTTKYQNRDFHRSVSVYPKRADSRAVDANGRLSFAVDLPPGGKWHCCLIYEASDGQHEYQAPVECIAHCHQSMQGQRLEQWKDTVLKISSSHEDFHFMARQAIEDMAALRLPVNGFDHVDFLPAAGLPWFLALFGRDSLIVSLQTMLVYSGFARGALAVLGALQATERDDYRDAEPGKILHEKRAGELAHFRMIPHTPYYGTADATPLYPVVLHETWRCTGDRSLLERHLPIAERCLAWIDEYGDRDGDGFQEYQTRSPVGYENMAWKDAGDSVRYPDGTLVKGPKALCELQGYVYDAWQRMAEVYDVLGKSDRAAELREKASNLFRRFNEAFWDEASGFYAYALDGEKKQVLSVASNPGHLLWSGIVPPERAGRVVARLMRPDMWSGWGIRTLSAQHASFNPYSYQNGSVWPHDNSIIALGFRRYGFTREAGQIAGDITRAAGFFMQHQLPELYAGIQRDATNFPVQYLGANVPQAWAAGSVFWLLQAILGLQPDAPNRCLFIDPALPDWLPDLTVSDLRVGDQRFALRFWLEGNETRHEVLEGDRAAVLHRPFGDAWKLQGIAADVA